MFLRVGNVNLEKVKAYHREHPGERRIFGTLIKEHAARGEFTIPRAHILVFQEPDGWAWRINCTRLLGLDATDPDDLTTAEIEGRRQVAFLMDFLRKHVPGFENCVLIETGAQAGVRETRRIVGEYVLQVTDLAAEKPFPDTIALSSYPVDIHQVDGSFGGVTDEYRTANAYSIPYRSLVPLQVDGLLAAGRCLSATHEARQQAPCGPCLRSVPWGTRPVWRLRWPRGIASLHGTSRSASFRPNCSIRMRS